MLNVTLVHEDGRATTTQAETHLDAVAFALYASVYASIVTSPVVRVFIGGRGALEETSVEALRVQWPSVGPRGGRS